MTPAQYSMDLSMQRASETGREIQQLQVYNRDLSFISNNSSIIPGGEIGANGQVETAMREDAREDEYEEKKLDSVKSFRQSDPS